MLTEVNGDDMANLRPFVTLNSHCLQEVTGTKLAPALPHPYNAPMLSHARRQRDGRQPD